jgi:hypothetical protein
MATSRPPVCEATCSGVWPSSSRMLGSALCFSNSSSMSSFHVNTLACSGVRSRLSRELTSVPSSRSRFAIVSLPFCEATCSGVWQSSSGTSGSALWSSNSSGISSHVNTPACGGVRPRLSRELTLTPSFRSRLTTVVLRLLGFGVVVNSHDNRAWKPLQVA